MKRAFALLTLAGAALSLTDAVVGSSFGQNTRLHICGNQYQESNGNSIAGFVRGANGQLQPIPGSPFLTGGAGTQDAGISLGPEDSDQDIITNPDHTLLFAVNSGSDTIAIFHIGGNGELTPVEDPRSPREATIR